MSQVVPESHKDLLEKPAFGNLGTLMKDGSPQVTPRRVSLAGFRPSSMFRDFQTRAFRANPYGFLELPGSCRPPYQIKRNSFPEFSAARLNARWSVLALPPAPNPERLRVRPVLPASRRPPQDR